MSHSTGTVSQVPKTPDQSQLHQESWTQTARKSAVRVFEQYSPTVPNGIAAGAVVITVGAVYATGGMPDLVRAGIDFAAHATTAAIAQLPPSKVNQNVGMIVNGVRAVQIVYDKINGLDPTPLISYLDLLLHTANAAYFKVQSMAKAKES